MKSLLTVLAIAIVACYLFQPVTPAHAASFIVTNLNDAGPGSLRQAITDANATPGGDTITFSGSSKGIGGGTIALSGPLPVITDALTIQGPGQAFLTIDAAAKGRAQVINAPNKTVEIYGLTYTGGLGPFGGAIYAQSGLVSLHDLVFTNNATLPGGGDGGAVSNDAQMTISNAVFTNNRGAFGGAISNFLGSATLNNLQVTANTAFDGTGSPAFGVGGGVFNLGVMTINNSTISGNTVGACCGGGGVYHDFITSGGLPQPSALTINNSHIDNNLAVDGGGGGIQSFGDGLIIRGSTINSNRAGVLTGTNTLLGGGGLAVFTGAVVQDTQINGNVIGGQDGTGGGALVASLSSAKPSIVLQRVNINGNTASWGGGIGTINGPATVVLDESTLSGNKAGIGGGIYNETDFAVQNSTVSGNVADKATGKFQQGSVPTSGGGIYTRNGSLTTKGTMAITNSTISGNISNAGDGGGIYNAQGGTLGLRHVTLVNNTALLTSGGLLNDGPFTPKNSIIAGNSAPSAANCRLITAATSASRNIISDNSCAFGDLPNTDPQLGALANNGGFTLTHLPAPASPAIDAGDNSASSTRDQRGVTRPKGAVVDIGAVEVDKGKGLPGASQSSAPSNDTATGLAAPYLAELAELKALPPQSSLQADTLAPPVGSLEKKPAFTGHRGATATPLLQPVSPIAPNPVIPQTPLTPPDGLPSAIPAGLQPLKGR